jgi:hypothetical protein
MNTLEIILFIAVLTAGIYLFIKGRRYGKTRKAYFENKAFEEVSRLLAGINPGQYQFYRLKKTLLGKDDCRYSTLEEMQDAIVEDSKKITTTGHIHAEARFSIRIDNDKKHIHYFVGANNYDFNKVSHRI